MCYCHEMYGYSGCHFLHPLRILVVWNLADFRTERQFCRVWISFVKFLLSLASLPLRSTASSPPPPQPQFFHINFLPVLSPPATPHVTFISSYSGRSRLVPERSVGLYPLNVNFSILFDIFNLSVYFSCT
jgi:hypothetical protein